MSQTVDRIVTVFKAMSKTEKIELVSALATDPDIAEEVKDRNKRSVWTDDPPAKKKSSWKKTKTKSSWWMKTFTGVENENAEGKKLKGTFRVVGNFIKNYQDNMGIGDLCVVHSRVSSEYVVCTYTKETKHSMKIQNDDGTEVVFGGLRADMSFDNANALCDHYEDKF